MTHVQVYTSIHAQLLTNHQKTPHPQLLINDDKAAEQPSTSPSERSAALPHTMAENDSSDQSQSGKCHHKKGRR